MASGSKRRRDLAREHYLRQERRRDSERATAVKRRRAVVASVMSVIGVLVVAAAATWAARALGGGDEAPSAGVAGSASPAGCTWTRSPATGGGKAVPLPPTTPDTTGLSTATVALRDLGTLRLVLDGTKAPCAVTSFRHLAALRYFDSTPCHRLTTSPTLKVLQCGSPGGAPAGGPGYTFPDEALTGATYRAGTVAMANSGPNTNGSQFFVVYGDSRLPPSYPPFGRLAGGLDVVRRIAAKGVKGGGADGSPAQPVVITSVTVAPPVGTASTPARPAPSGTAS